jgi:hypothetical protein
MSHWTKIKTTIEFKDPAILEMAVDMLEGNPLYRVQKAKDRQSYWIDIRAELDKTTASLREGAPGIAIRKEGDQYTVHADTWGLKSHVDTLVKQVQQNYNFCTVRTFLVKGRYTSAIKQEGNSIKILARKW